MARVSGTKPENSIATAKRRRDHPAPRVTLWCISITPGTADACGCGMAPLVVSGAELRFTDHRGMLRQAFYSDRIHHHRAPAGPGTLWANRAHAGDHGLFHAAGRFRAQRIWSAGNREGSVQG